MKKKSARNPIPKALRRSGLTPMAKLVYLELACHKESKPTLTYTALAERIGATIGGVRLGVNHLEQAGWLKVTPVNRREGFTFQTCTKPRNTLVEAVEAATESVSEAAVSLGYFNKALADAFLGTDNVESYALPETKVQS